MNTQPAPSHYRPLKVVDVELSQPVGDLDGLAGYDAVRGLVRFHGEPLGYIQVGVVNNRCAGSTLARAALSTYGPAIICHLVADGLAAPAGELRIDDLIGLAHPDDAGPAPFVTVAVCTRNRPDDLARCLEAIAELDYPSFEVVVVDNAPSDDRTEQLVRGRFPQVRYVREPRPGLSNARNRAIAEARGEIVAFTDDDVVVDRGWVGAIARVFAENPGVVGLTGLVVPLELETEAQILFEVHGGFGRGFARQLYRYQPGHPGTQATYQGTGRFGTGANMAYRRSLFAQIGGFDPALGVGTSTQGGEDLEMFFRLLRAGHTLAYEPAAMVRHRHRRDYDALRRQLENNGLALAAYHGRCALIFPEQRAVFVRLHLWWLWAWHIKRLLQSLTRPHRFPRGLILAELRGYLIGLTRYPQARRAARAAAPTLEHTGAPIHAQV